MSIVDNAQNHLGSLDDYDCAVCGQTLPTLASLQAHLLARHCSQSDTVLRLVREMQEQLKEIQTSHYSLVSDVKIVKDNMQIKQSPPPPAAPPAPPAPAQTLPPAAPSYAAAAGAGAAGAAAPRQSAASRPHKISFVTDSIGDNVITR